MKHEELYLRLRKTKPYFQTKTLKAIIELHKPYETKIANGGIYTTTCNCCETNYPCQTIQVIEKELA